MFEKKYQLHSPIFITGNACGIKDDRITVVVVDGEAAKTGLQDSDRG